MGRVGFFWIPSVSHSFFLRYFRYLRLESELGVDGGASQVHLILLTPPSNRIDGIGLSFRYF